jgi:hypothetical protein
MAYADDLLELAQQLANLEPTNPRQASLRRAVSTAYYGLFHLLISEATLNWGRPELRSELGRIFMHGKMKSASVEKRAELDAQFKKNPPPSPELAVFQHRIRSLTPSFKYNSVARKRTTTPGRNGRRPMSLVR